MGNPLVLLIYLFPELERGIKWLANALPNKTLRKVRVHRSRCCLRAKPRRRWKHVG